MFRSFYALPLTTTGWQCRLVNHLRKLVFSPSQQTCCGPAHFRVKCWHSEAARSVKSRSELLWRLFWIIFILTKRFLRRLGAKVKQVSLHGELELKSVTSGLRVIFTYKRKKKNPTEWNVYIQSHFYSRLWRWNWCRFQPAQSSAKNILNARAKHIYLRAFAACWIQRPSKTKQLQQLLLPTQAWSDQLWRLLEVGERKHYWFVRIYLPHTCASSGAPPGDRAGWGRAESRGS